MTGTVSTRPPGRFGPPPGRGTCSSGDWTPLHPVVPQYVPVLDARDRRRVDRLAHELGVADPVLHRRDFGANVTSGTGPWTALHIHAGAGTVHFSSPVIREHRALFLARDGDTVVTRGPWVDHFAAHCRDDLGLGRVRSMRPERGEEGDRLVRSLMRDADLIERAARLARARGGLIVAPYIATEGVWAFASLVAMHARCPVKVAGSPPGVVARVNDKTWFARVAEKLLGAGALPPSRSANSWSLLASFVRETADRHGYVGIKLPSEAGSAGNLVLESGSLRRFRTLRELRTHLRHTFELMGWDQPFPTLVSVWEDRVLVSPSVQLWIPEDREHPVMVEGVFHQVVEGRVGQFVGCEPSDLAPPSRERLAAEAAVFGELFRRLGYYGRCSLDAILVGEHPGAARIHWVECNGRWGGTSIPMTLANRLAGDWVRRPFVVTGNVPVTGLDGFAEVRERLRDILYRPGVSEGLLCLSPAPAETGQGMNLMALAPTVERARSIILGGVGRLAVEPPTVH